MSLLYGTSLGISSHTAMWVTQKKQKSPIFSREINTGTDREPSMCYHKKHDQFVLLEKRSFVKTKLIGQLCLYEYAFRGNKFWT